ncbi:MAG: hypothetical protein RQ736_15070 [Thiogranum sp.]|nr:hypothetical protein [Thiogranum sp.]
MNILFEYLYRDAGNNTNWGEIIFSNPAALETDVIIDEINRLLIDQTYFDAAKVAVPDLHFSDFNEELDHGWHEFFSCRLTCDAFDDYQGRTIQEFLEVLRRSCPLVGGMRCDAHRTA